MTHYYGHQKQLEQLRDGLPPVTLLRGPQSVGKWSLGLYLHEVLKLSSNDLRAVPRLSVEDARELQRFASTGPWGRHKLALVRLDGASEAALNALLKTLEEPPPTISFILVASEPTLPTVASRSVVVNMGLLSETEVERILIDKLGLSEEQARRAARCSQGQVKTALAAIQEDASRALVLSVLKAVADGDEALLKAVITTGAGRVRWDETASALLDRWVVEALTGQWRIFQESESFGLPHDRALLRRMLIRLQKTARPRLALYAALQPLVSARTR